MEGDVEAQIEADVEAELLARRLDDVHEELACALFALNAARADAAAAAVAADNAERAAAVVRDVFDALKLTREVEQAAISQTGPHFSWDVRRDRYMRLNDAYARARAFFDGAPLAGTELVRVSAVVALLEGPAARAALDAAVSLDDACTRLATLVKALPR